MRLYEFGHNLYVSAQPSTQNAINVIKNAEITHVVSLAKRPIESALLDGSFHVEHMPLVDGKDPSVPDLLEVVDYVTHLLREGYVVLVHCHQGRNRSVAAAAIVQGRRVGWTGDKTVWVAREIRPKSLYNPVYEDLVRKLT